MSHVNGIATCPHCKRAVRTNDGRYGFHSVTEDGTNNRCPVSHQRTPVTGTTATDYVSRAQLVASLAGQVQDEDPAIVWDYITALPVPELHRMLQVALAAVPVDQTVSEIFAWVTELPQARLRGATA